MRPREDNGESVKIKSRFISLGDIHLLGNNPVSRKDDLTGTQWAKVHELFSAANAKSADILIAGDFSDHSNNYSILNNLAEILRAYKDLDVNAFAVFGQHDMKYRNEKDTNLQILSNAGLITILGSTPVLGPDFRVYGAGWKAPVPRPEDTKMTNILVTHAPISPKSLFHGHDYIPIEEFALAHNRFSLVLCGDVHRTFMEEFNGMVVMNSGPLIRKEADEYNMTHKPGFFYIDMEEVTIDFYEVTHRPAGEVLSRSHIEKKRAKDLVAARADTAQFLHELRERSNAGRLMNIKERIQTRIEPEAETSTLAKSILECLLNERNLGQWVERQGRLTKGNPSKQQ